MALGPAPACSCLCGRLVYDSYVRRGQAASTGEFRLARTVACSVRLAAFRPDLRPALLALLSGGPCHGHGSGPRGRALSKIANGLLRRGALGIRKPARRAAEAPPPGRGAEARGLSGLGRADNEMQSASQPRAWVAGLSSLVGAGVFTQAPP